LVRLSNLVRLSHDEKALRKGENPYAKHKGDVMFKSFVMIGLLGISLVARSGTEAEAAGGYRYCYGCRSDACQLETPLKGLFTLNDVANGLVSVECNTRSHGAGVRAGDVLCIDQGGNVAPGLPIQGSANGTFGVEEVLTLGDINGGVATKENHVSVSVAEFCANPPAACGATLPCYECYKQFFELPPESIGCPNAEWAYFAIDYDDLCVNFKLNVVGIPLLNVVRRCTDPGNTNFVNCSLDLLRCPVIP
jgi:hypothetical protein